MRVGGGDLLAIVSDKSAVVFVGTRVEQRRSSSFKQILVFHCLDNRQTFKIKS